MNRLLLTGVLALGILIPQAAEAQQQSPALDQLYGNGVHAFHSGDIQKAGEVFSQAIRLGTHDPRVYYFRGLTNTENGKMDAARNDFKIGAQLEISQAGRFYAVGRSLERVQGVARLEIENARRNARLAVVKQGASGDPNNDTVLSMPVIPDPVSNGTTVSGRGNLPDVTGIQHPGTPYADSATSSKGAAPNGNPVEAQADPGTTEKEADPFGNATNPPVAEEDPFADMKNDDKTPPLEEDPFGEANNPPIEDVDPFADQKESTKAPPKQDEPFAEDDKDTR